MAFSFWSVALLSTPDNRMVIARLTGLAHVPLALNDIHVSNSKHLRKEVEEGDVRRGVSWGVPIVVGEWGGHWKEAYDAVHCAPCAALTPHMPYASVHVRMSMTNDGIRTCRLVRRLCFA